MTTITTPKTCPVCDVGTPAWLAIPTASEQDNPHVTCNACKDAAERLRVPLRFVSLPRMRAATPEPDVRVEPDGQMALMDLTPPTQPTGWVPPTAPDSSRAMQAKAIPCSGTLRGQTLRLIARCPSGKTDDELEVEMGRSHQSASASRNSLMRDGWVYAAIDGAIPLHRVNRHGNDAQVWVATPAALRWLAGGAS